MTNSTRGRRGRLAAISALALCAPLAVATSASADAEISVFFEETGEAFWEVPHTCPDGTVVDATLLVRTTRDFETPETEDADPTARVQYLAVCPDGTSVSWGRRNTVPATITSTPNLKSITASGSGFVRDDFSTALHDVSFDVIWTGSGPLRTTAETISNQGFRITTSIEQERTATADGEVVADGVALVDGVTNHPFRPTFMNTLQERTTRPPSN